MNKNLIVTLVIGLVSGAIGAMAVNALDKPSQEELIHSFYETETAVMVSPHGLRKKIAYGEQGFILVDLRSPQEYEKEHIVGALNVPAYTDPDTSAYNEVDRIVSSFKDIEKQYEGRDVIVYCYSMPCMTGRKIGHMLAQHGVYVKELGVGWNEWRHFWTLWNLEHEWEITNVEDYVIAGAEPGAFKGEIPLSPCTIGQFGC